MCDLSEVRRECKPVKMFWKASSTLLASRAEVSMNDKLFSPMLRSARPTLNPWGTQRKHTRKLLGFFRGHCPQVSQIALISDQHDDDVGIGVIPQLLQPPVDILVGLMFANIVNEESADRATVVGRGNRPVTFLTSSIPNLSLDRLGIDLDGAGCEFDTDSRLGVQVELVTGETAQQVGLSDTRISDQHHYARYSR